MTDPYALTELQLAILGILWDRGEATSRDVRDALEPDRPLALTTVATLLSRLERRGVLAHRRSGRSYVFRPTVSRDEVRTAMVRDLAENLFDGDRIALIDHVLGGGTDASVREQMRSILEEDEVAAGTEDVHSA